MTPLFLLAFGKQFRTRPIELLSTRNGIQNARLGEVSHVEVNPPPGAAAAVGVSEEVISHVHAKAREFREAAMGLPLLQEDGSPVQ